MKTVKELSEAVNISKVSVYKAINHKLKDELKGHVYRDEKNTLIIDDIGEIIIINYFSREKKYTLDNIIDNISSENDKLLTDNKVNSKLDEEVKNIDIITTLSVQLTEKDNQIKSLLEIVANQQKLHATHFIKDNNNSNVDDLKKKSFFKKIFRL